MADKQTLFPTLIVLDQSKLSDALQHWSNFKSGGWQFECKYHALVKFVYNAVSTAIFPNANLTFASPEEAVWTGKGYKTCRPSFQTLSEGPGKCKFNETGKHVWSLFLHILPAFNLNHTAKVASTLKYNLSYTGFLKQNGVSVKLSNDIMSPQRHRRAQRFREQKHRQNDQSRLQRFSV